MTYKTYIATGTDEQTGELKAVYGGQTTQDIEQRMAQHKIRGVCEHHGWRFGYTVVGVHPSKEAMTAAEDALIESLFETYSTRCLNEKRKSPAVQAAKPSKNAGRTAGKAGGSGALPKGLLIHYPPNPTVEHSDKVFAPYAVVFLNGEVVGDVAVLRGHDEGYWMPSQRGGHGLYCGDVIYQSFAGALSRLLSDHEEETASWEETS